MVNEKMLTITQHDLPERDFIIGKDAGHSDSFDGTVYSKTKGNRLATKSTQREVTVKSMIM